MRDDIDKFLQSGISKYTSQGESEIDKMVEKRTQSLIPSPPDKFSFSSGLSFEEEQKCLGYYNKDRSDWSAYEADRSGWLQKNKAIQRDKIMQELGSHRVSSMPTLETVAEQMHRALTRSRPAKSPFSSGLDSEEVTRSRERYNRLQAKSDEKASQQHRVSDLVVEAKKYAEPDHKEYSPNPKRYAEIMRQLLCFYDGGDPKNPAYCYYDKCKPPSHLQQGSSCVSFLLTLDQSNLENGLTPPKTGYIKCKFFTPSSSSCKSGASCEYSHSLGWFSKKDLLKDKASKFYKDTKCRFFNGTPTSCHKGENCKFSHT